ncbi:hypothetical protein [Neptunicella sp. SCSIO 80796]|uniref:hypothetical protein n=1 Tax=Neptunicella plasticusilytica TaxID=3117012 RepID=UPI003A4DE27E
MNHPFKHYQTVFVPNSIMAETRSNDRRSVILPDNNFKVGGIVEMKSDTEIGSLNSSIINVITAIDRGAQIAAGFCCVQYQPLHHVLPQSLYRVLKNLVEENNELREKLSAAIGASMRKMVG